MRFYKMMCSCVFSLACLSACTTAGVDVPDPEELIDPSTPALTLTSAAEVAIFGKYLLVADCGYSAMESPLPYKEGRLAVIDRDSMQLVNFIKTSALNPQWVTVVGNKAYVVSSGAMDFDMNTYLAYAASDGAIDILDMDDVTKWEASIPLPRSKDDTRLGSFGRLAVTADGRTGYMGSGTTNAVFEVDLANKRIVRGTDNPIDVLEREGASTNGMTSLRMFNNKVYLAAFNNDAVCVADAVSDHLGSGENAPVCGSVGGNDEMIEGPIDLTLDYNNIDLIVAMSVANATYYVEFDQGHGRFTVTQTGKTGSSPNAIGKSKPYVYIVNSMNSSITRQNMSTHETTLSWAVLPANSNPMYMAIDSESEKIYVSLAGTGNIAVVSLKDGKIIAYATQKK